MNAATVNVQQVRDQHPIEGIVADTGVELRRAGQGWMGRCPFHDDTTASLSVGGVAGRFHCFGCGAHGDVIDFVRLRYDLSFREAVDRLDGASTPHRSTPAIPLRPDPPSPDISAERVQVINELAWLHYTRPVGHAFAVSWLRHRRSIDIAPLESVHRAPMAGHTGAGWTGLTEHVRSEGITDAELLAADLAQTTRRATLIDTLRDRLILPIRDHHGELTGFVGRETSGNPRAPKYRNPTHTPTFIKATALYTPRSGAWARTSVVVEGPLDALAIAASSAAAKRPGAITAVSALGAQPTAAQVDHVVTHAPGHIVIALDGDIAGLEGTKRWVDAVCRGHGRAALVTQLPDGLDPADWVALHGPDGLAAFDPDARHAGLGVRPGPAQPRQATAVAAPRADRTVVRLPIGGPTPTLR